MKRPVHILLSVFIVICLALQVYAFRGRKLIYPFIDYPMYNMASGPPVQVAMRRLFVEMPDGQEIEANPAYFGVGFFAWRFRVVEPLVQPPARVEHPRILQATFDQAMAHVIDVVARHEGSAPVAAVIRTHWHQVRDGRIIESDDTVRVPFQQTGIP